MRNRRRYRGMMLTTLGLVLVALVSAAVVSAVAQSDGETSADDKINLLIVDETKTFQASLVVNALAGGLNQTGRFNVKAVFPDVHSSYDDPLGENTGDATYEIILVVPKASVLFGLGQLWIASCDIPHRASPAVIEGVIAIQRMIANNGGMDIRALSVVDDAMPGYFATLFMKHGWLSCGSES